MSESCISNPKLQIPNPNHSQIPNPKMTPKSNPQSLPKPALRGVGIGVRLGFGTWE
jgi:hypothetical protein